MMLTADIADGDEEAEDENNRAGFSPARYAP